MQIHFRQLQINGLRLLEQTLQYCPTERNWKEVFSEDLQMLGINADLELKIG